jgi:hypothetical protein
LHTGKVHLSATRAKISLNACPITSQFLGLTAAECGHAQSSRPLRRKVVDHAHKSNAHDPDAYHAQVLISLTLENVRECSDQTCSARFSVSNQIVFAIL